jgi:hypothetical protein
MAQQASRESLRRCEQRMDSAGVNTVLPTHIPVTAASPSDFLDEVLDNIDDSAQGIVLGDRRALEHRKSMIGARDYMQAIWAGRQLLRASERIAVPLHHEGG